jgi:hypothetical protein
MMDEMRDRAGSDLFSVGKGIDVDLVLLKSIGTEADYVDLPAGILGRTIFAPDGQVRIEVSRALSDQAESDQIARRRLRTTLAHECGHVACHTCLFIRDTETIPLFETGEATARGVSRPPIMCRPEGVGHLGYQGEWWEYQANRCMAALLLPKRMVAESARMRLRDGGFKSGAECVALGHGEVLIREISNEYDVSQAAVLFRLQALGFVPTGVQMEMRLVD